MTTITCPRCNGKGTITPRPVGRPPTINPQDKPTIRQRINNGERGVDLAKEYGVTPSTISRIHRNVGPRN